MCLGGKVELYEKYEKQTSNLPLFGDVFYNRICTGRGISSKQQNNQINHIECEKQEGNVCWNETEE